MVRHDRSVFFRWILVAGLLVSGRPGVVERDDPVVNPALERLLSMDGLGGQQQAGGAAGSHTKGQQG